MAATVRLTVDRIALVGVGPFGTRVAEILAGAFRDGTVLLTDDVEQVRATGCDAMVAAFWRPAPDLCERADELAHERAMPWLPVVAEASLTRVGPLVSPGRGPCFRCYWRRRAQHDVRWASTKALWDAYAADPALGPGGYLPQQARLCAGLAAAMVRRNEPAVVATVGTSPLTLQTDRVLACHGCPRCRPPDPRRDLRRLLRMPEVHDAARR